MYTHEILQKLKILCIQEHWLYKCNKSYLDKTFPCWTSSIRSIDEYEEDEEMLSRFPRGKGGVATMWRKEFSNYVTKCSEGNTRVLPVKLSLGALQILIINCYLPSGTSPTALISYDEDMDIISELILKYSSSCTITILGDLQADIYNRNKEKEVMLRELISRHGLEDLGGSDVTGHTYINPALLHASRIDYILLKRSDPANRGDPWSPLKIHEHAPSNTSTHTLITTTIITDFRPKSKTCTKVSTKQQWHWDQADLTQFQSTTRNLLTSCNTDLLDPAAAIDVFNDILSIATTAAVPVTERRIGGPKRNQPKWTPEFKAAETASKAAHFAWKCAGKPPNHPLHSKVMKTKKTVRRVQRVATALERKSLLAEVSAAAAWDRQLLNKLIARQRATPTDNQGLLINGQLITDDLEILEAWAEYYEQLATPSSPDDQEDLRLLDQLRLLSRTSADKIVVTPVIIGDAIKQLKRNKAADVYGFCAEQLKLLPEDAYPALASILTRIFQQGLVPKVLKAAYKFPIPKKNKNPKIQDHHRGIAIAPILGKVLEIVCMKTGYGKLPNNKLQFGFTDDRAPTMASLIVTEAKADARVNKTPLFGAPLDGKKAFDVVNHTILKIKLFQTGVNHRIWSVIDDLYIDSTEAVKINGALSTEYSVMQGVKQGNVTSPPSYKVYVHQLLEQLQTASIGLSIGGIYLGSPTCADDILLLSRCPYELQSMITINEIYSKRNRYEIHADPDPLISKSCVTPLFLPAEHKAAENSWEIYGIQLPCTEEFAHLGLDWQQGKLAPCIQAKIKKARQTAYSMLKPGMHGSNGLDPSASYKLIQTYVLPVLLYGLEAVILSTSEVELLENFYRGLLRRVQSLPESCAKEAVYLLLGAVPVQTLIHQRVLCLLGSISRMGPDESLHRLATRQLGLSVKPSWFAYVTDICNEYNMDANTILNMKAKKDELKRYVKAITVSKAQTTLSLGLLQKSTLCKLIIPSTIHPQMHPIWFALKGCPHMVPQAEHKAKLLVGRGPLNGTLWRQRSGRDTKCPLCRQNPEDVEHHLLHCAPLESARAARMLQLHRIWTEDGASPPRSPSEWSEAILNGTGYRSSTTGILISLQNEDRQLDAQRLTLALCYKLLVLRDESINAELTGIPLP